MTAKTTLALCIFPFRRNAVGRRTHTLLDVGCERMSTTRFVIMHIAAAVAPFFGGIIGTIAI